MASYSQNYWHMAGESNMRVCLKMGYAYEILTGWKTTTPNESRDIRVYTGTSRANMDLQAILEIKLSDLTSEDAFSLWLF